MQIIKLSDGTTFHYIESYSTEFNIYDAQRKALKIILQDTEKLDRIKDIFGDASKTNRFSLFNDKVPKTDGNGNVIGYTTVQNGYSNYSILAELTIGIAHLADGTKIKAISIILAQLTDSEIIRPQINKILRFIDDEIAITVPDLFPFWTHRGYVDGQRVRCPVNGSIYKCSISHAKVECNDDDYPSKTPKYWATL